MGSIGSNGQAVCESQFNSCDGGTFGLVNGIQTCISDDYGPPEICPGSSVSVFDGYGFTCEPLMGGDNSPEWQEPPPNIDTDNDGVPDAYDPSSDSAASYYAMQNIYNQQSYVIEQNNITNNNLSNINKNIKQGNSESQQSLDGINASLDGIAGDLAALKGMGESGDLGGGSGTGEGGTEGLQDEEGNDYLADIEKNTKDTADALQAPEGGLAWDGLEDGVPTLSESMGSFKAAVIAHPAIASLQGLSDLPETTTCPVYTLPSTPISGELVMDIHCGVVDEYRSLISGMFLFFWAGLALITFLRA
jgi:hypothetical protein